MGEHNYPIESKSEIGEDRELIDIKSLQNSTLWRFRSGKAPVDNKNKHYRRIYSSVNSLTQSIQPHENSPIIKRATSVSGD